MAGIYIALGAGRTGRRKAKRELPACNTYYNVNIISVTPLIMVRTMKGVNLMRSFESSRMGKWKFTSYSLDSEIIVVVQDTYLEAASVTLTPIEVTIINARWFRLFRMCPFVGKIFATQLTDIARWR